MIKSILCYASESWCACDLAKRNFRTGDGFAKYLNNVAIEKVYVKFCKFILGVNKRAVNLAGKGELGRFPISCSSFQILVSPSGIFQFSTSGSVLRL